MYIPNYTQRSIGSVDLGYRSCGSSYFGDFEVGGAPGKGVEVDGGVGACGSPGVIADGEATEDTIECSHA